LLVGSVTWDECGGLHGFGSISRKSSFETGSFWPTCVLATDSLAARRVVDIVQLLYATQPTVVPGRPAPEVDQLLPVADAITMPGSGSSIRST
jgi:hypothetical protein